MKCHSPAFVSHAHCLYSEATFATFSSCFFSMQTQNLLDWWRHFHGFEELRSGSAQVGAEFPTVIFITTIVMKHQLFSLSFWQNSARAVEVSHSALISMISRRPYHTTQLLLILIPLLIFFYLFILASGWRCIRIIKHSLVTEAVPAGRRTTF